MNYYNEIDAYCAQWLRNLIAAGLIPDGFVDERSIKDVQPKDLVGYTQCHFFAGIGGWPLALRLAGWPDDREIWTGSPPCQPFSNAGRRGGYDDARHLAPKWLELIKQCQPAGIAGEQVAGAFTDAKHHWIDDLQDALEAQGYATGQIVLPACCLGAAHIRQRGWFVAQRLGHAGGERLPQQQRVPGDIRQEASANPGEAIERGGTPVGGVADAGSERRQQDARGPHGNEEAHGREGRNGGEPDSDNQFAGHGEVHGCSTPHSQWTLADWLHCRDEKWRPVEPGSKPLADGVPGRVGRLRAYGNAIVPQVAAEVIGAFMEATK